MDQPGTTSGDATWRYIYDASGNVMSVYLQWASGNPFVLEQGVYGKEREGTYYRTYTDNEYNKYGLEIKDHLGNVRAVVAGSKWNGIAISLNLYDYYPLGGAMPYRVVEQSDIYRYGFNGKEKDVETGNIDFGSRAKE